jgi:hypothetical protein
MDSIESPSVASPLYKISNEDLKFLHDYFAVPPPSMTAVCKVVMLLRHNGSLLDFKAGDVKFYGFFRK